MKFLDKDELNDFLLETGHISKINKVDVDSFVPEVEMLEGIFIKRNEKRKTLTDDYRKGKDTEGQWRGMRYKMLKGIRRYHKSAEGKRQHRAMARYMVNRDSRPDIRSELSLQEKSHLITDIDNYVLNFSEFVSKYHHPLDGYVDLLEIKEVLVSMCENTISILISKEDMTEDHEDFIMSLVESNNIVEVLSEDLDITTDKVLELWNASKKSLTEENTIESLDFYREIIKNIKKI